MISFSTKLFHLVNVRSSGTVEANLSKKTKDKWNLSVINIISLTLILPWNTNELNRFHLLHCEHHKNKRP